MSATGEDHEAGKSQSPTAPPISPLVVALLIILALAIPVIGPVAALIIGSVRRARPGASGILRVGKVMLILDFVLGIPASMYLPGYIKAGILAKECEVKSNCHTIQIALERYYVDNSEYPSSLQELVDTRHLVSFPENPFTEEPMREVVFRSSDCAGNVTYLPITEDGKVTNWFLLGYGNGRIPGRDVDGDGVGDNVIIVITGGSEVDPSMGDLLERLVSPR